jgi:hypothetical protein
MQLAIAARWLLLLPLVVGCNRSTHTDIATAEAQRGPVHVDSVIPRAEALRRFQQGLPRPDSLQGGAPSRDSLVHLFVRALERQDTTALRTLQLSKAEFAYLYYPTSAQGLPPYDLSPALMWFMLEGGSEKGITRALGQFGGRPLRSRGYVCASTPAIEGENRLWGPCEIRRVQAQGDSVTDRMFGPIVERGGRWKFVSYANKL